MNSGLGGDKPTQESSVAPPEGESDAILCIPSLQVKAHPPRRAPPLQAWAEEEEAFKKKKRESKVSVQSDQTQLTELPVNMAAKVAPLDIVEVKGPGKNYVRLSEPSRTNSEDMTASMKTDQFTPAKSGTASQGATSSRRGSIVHSVRHGVRNFMHWSGWYDSPFTVRVRRFIRGRVFATLAMVCLMLALFLSDVFVLLQVSSNVEQDAILTVVFAVFALEFISLSMTDASYLFGFFFWMDLVGTVSMIFDISYLLGTSANEPEKRETESGRDNLIVVRLARAAKLGARAGRLSRVLKLLRFLPFLNGDEQSSEKNVKMARVISNQLTNVISTRVAFLSICIVIFLPFLGMWTYPEMDDSMGAWTQLLATNAQDYLDAQVDPQTGNVTTMRRRLDAELLRFSNFYKSNSYGPFDCCYGVKTRNEFQCERWRLDVVLSPNYFAAPDRRSSIREVSQDNFQASFDLSTPKQLEAAGNIILFVLIMLIMIVFGLVTSSSISVIALEPLERMLTMVREKCAQIFKYTNPLLENDEEVENQNDEDFDDMEHSSEFVLLEKVVSKLAAIADLATTRGEPEVRENMDENEIMALNWMQGQPVVAGPGRSSKDAGRGGRSSQRETPLLGQDHEMSHPGEVEAHTPRDDTSVEISKMSIPEEVLVSLEGEMFDAFSLPKTVTHKVIALHVILSREGCSVWLRANVQESRLVKFITNVEAGYHPNPWHNFSHALDTLYAVDRFMTLMDASCFLAEVSQFWVMVAASAHDIGHAGVNNQFLVETAHELALRYNDRSPLENMHCARLFQVVSDPEANIFAQVDKDLYKEMRKGMINSILHTDVTKHNDMIKDLNILYQMNSEVFDCPGGISQELIEVLQTSANTQLMLNALLHCADIGNPMKPWELCKSHAYLILDEFFAQGDREKELGIPVQMLNDRDKVNRPNSQIGFIEFVIAGMAESMVNLFPMLDSLAQNLQWNVERWCEMWIECQEASPDGEKAKAQVLVRVGKITSKLKAVMRGQRQLPSEINQ